MSLPSVKLIINTSAPRKDSLIANFKNQSAVSGRLFFRGDVNRLEIYPVVEASPGSGYYWETLTIDDPNDLLFGIGDADQPSTDGTAELNYDGDTSGISSTAPTITAADLQTALNSNVTIDATGQTIEVEEAGPGAYFLYWSGTGAKELVQGDPANLIPLSTVYAAWITEGDADHKAVQVLQFITRPYVFVEEWTETPALAPVVTELRAGSVSAKAMYSISMSREPYKGTFSIGDSAPMGFDGAESAWQTALGSEWTVLKSGVASLSIERVENGTYSLDESDVNVENLTDYKGYIGKLNFNRPALFQKFLEVPEKSFSSTMHCRTDDGEYVDTLLLMDVTLAKDILSNAALSPVDFDGRFYTRSQTDALLEEKEEEITAIEKATTFGDNEKIFGTEYLSSFHKKVMAGTATKILFAGDSTTAGESIVDPANEIDQVVLRNLNQFLTNVTVENYGVGATNTYQWANDVSGAHSVEIQLVEEPDLWVIRYGINDSNWSDDHPFQEAVDRLNTALRQGLQKIRDTQGDESVTSIVVMSPNTAIGGSQTLAWKEATNHIFRDVCREFKCAFIDTYGLWSDSGDPEADCDYLDNANSGHYHPLDVMNLWIGGAITDAIFPFSLRALNSNKRQNGQYDFNGGYTLDVSKTKISITKDSLYFINKDQPTNQKRMHFYFGGDKLYLLSPNDNDSGFVTIAVFEHSGLIYSQGGYTTAGTVTGSNLSGTNTGDYSLVKTVPGSASATGTAGQYAFDSSYFYLCIATNTWMRAAIATW